MGVTGLWTVVQPCARPIKIETLNKKRLAVDASIWIYQFLKAVRDKEGNALRNSHVVGFFRRICKLLFIGIKPVFVFDGGAPALKRQTISGRKQRREGRREDAVRTAGKLLALQMQRRAEEEEQNRRAAASGRTNADTEEAIPEDVVYAAELQMTPKERQQNRKFRKKDQYHLPELDMSMAEMGGPNDPRVMSLEELEEYARQFNAGEDINVYDFSKIDFNSAFFLSLPPSDRYNILNAARLRSRLRLGYSKDQLDAMFPDRMAFSKFQIERVAERNELTQRLMHVNGMGDNGAWDADGTGRVSGEKGREYVLVKNESAEGGWALGVIGDKTEGERNKPIDIDKIAEDQALDEEDEAMSEDEGAFEDVPVEGLNRIPKSMLRRKSPPRAQSSTRPLTGDILRKRKALYKSRLGQTELSPGPEVDNIADEMDEVEDGTDQLFHTERQDSSASEDEGNEDDNLRKAIAMSLEQVDIIPAQQDSDVDDDYKEVFGGSEAEHKSQQPATSTQLSVDIADKYGKAGHADDNNSSGDDEFDFGIALAQSKKSTKKSETSPSNREQQKGPLPFQTLDLGSSILGKASKGRGKNKVEEEGGFVKEADGEEKAPQPLPPWFSKSDDIRPTARAASKTSARNDGDYAIDSSRNGSKPGRIRRQQTREVIDLDGIEDKQPETIDVDSDDAEVGTTATLQDATNKTYETSMGDLAERMQAEPPQAQPDNIHLAPRDDERDSAEPLEWEESDQEDTTDPAGEGMEALAEAESGSEPEFENVEIPATIPQDDGAPESTDRPAFENGNEPKADTAVEDDKEQPVVTEEAQTGTGFDEFDFPSDAEEDEMMRRLAAEAEEHARFASTLNKKSYTRNIEEYESELKALRTQQKKDRRDADEVTQIMVEECQQLLALFGIPFITAPMEAEAQCAELVTLGLVDGIVTDDSDIFLFGGTRIYKNMFNQAKYVECYLASDLERDFDLTRTRLIRLAHLLGSDYTEGIPGVGPVTALEIVAEFPDGLDDFRDWWSAVQTGRVPATEDASSAFRKKFRKNAAKVFTPPNFPDKRVDLAYLQPEVDTDPSEFKWGVPDLDRLRSYLMATIGWSQERTDEVLVPVVRDMNRREHEGTQANITSFMGAGSSVGAGAFAPHVREGKSKRMETALGRMAARAREKKKRKHGDNDEQDANDDFVAPEDAVIAIAGSGGDEQVAQRRLPTREDGPMRLADLAAEEEEGEQSNEDMGSKKASKKSASRPKKKKQRAGL